MSEDRLRRTVRAGLPWLLCALPAVVAAQPAQGGTEPATTQVQPPTLELNVTVIGSTPLPGIGLPADQVPAPLQVISAKELETSGALDLSDFMNRRLNGVHINEVQNNPFQADVNYRGYSASPLLGTPQGLSVYMDGMRLNQPFGDVVSWDLIPRIAISSTVVMPGSNPMFGLNTLGGALSIQTKDGRVSPGTTIQATYGSNVRRAVDFEHGGSRAASGLHYYLAGSLFGEDGWRTDSPTDVRQIFGKIGWYKPTNELSLSLGHADNDLYGNGLQEVSFLDRDYSSVYTKPDITENRSTLVNLNGRRELHSALTMAVNGYYRHVRTNTFNGDINEDALDQAVYQPGAAEQAALAAAGYTGFPTSGATAANTPFPFWRCLGNVLLTDEPAEKCNGLINRTNTSQYNFGGSGQLTLRRTPDRRHQLTVGVAYDRAHVGFDQSSELGYLTADRGVTGTGAFGDGVTGGDVDGEPFDTRVDLTGVQQTVSLYATDTVSVGDAVNLTFSGRFNRTTVFNEDGINPGGGAGSLDGDHVFTRFNPAVGLTYAPSKTVTTYAGYSEGSRAATSIELGCADPESPCKLPNAMAGDPPLNQVVTRTVEAGLRGRGRTNWNAGFFHSDNNDDILFVTSEQTGFGYFRNFGKTRRQGIELGADTRAGRATIGASYTFLDAAFQSEETVNGEANSSNEDAEEGLKGLEGEIEIEPGNRLPLIPQHLFKAFADIDVTSKLSVSINVVGISSVFARGNENNLHDEDPPYYLGPGTAPGYAVVNLGGRFNVTPRVQVIGQVNNLFDRQYYTSAQLGPMGFTDTGNFVARPFPAVDGEFPVQNSTFFAPGAPIRAWLGFRLSL